MNTLSAIYDPAALTLGQAEALRDAGAELEMLPDRRIRATVDMGHIFDREEEKRVERNLG